MSDRCWWYRHTRVKGQRRKEKGMSDRCRWYRHTRVKGERRKQKGERDVRRSHKKPHVNPSESLGAKEA